jgi:hypothetical protein
MRDGQLNNGFSIFKFLHGVRARHLGLQRVHLCQQVHHSGAHRGELCLDVHHLLRHGLVFDLGANNLSGRTLVALAWSDRVRNRTLRISHVRNRTLRILKVRNRTLRISHFGHYGARHSQRRY